MDIGDVLLFSLVFFPALLKNIDSVQACKGRELHINKLAPFQRLTRHVHWKMLWVITAQQNAMRQCCMVVRPNITYINFDTPFDYYTEKDVMCTSNFLNMKFYFIS